jgi:hypothetical protein
VEPDTFILFTLWFGSLLGNDYLCNEQCLVAPNCNVETANRGQDDVLTPRKGTSVLRNSAHINYKHTQPSA